jgi:hypothetical protein
MTDIRRWYTHSPPRAMKTLIPVAILSLFAGFFSGVFFQSWRSTLPPRYQIVSSGQSGNAFRLDVVSGDTWLLTSQGEETLVLPPGPQLTRKGISDLHKTLRDANVEDIPETVRDYSIKLTRDRPENRGLWDNGALRSTPPPR